ncbi:hydroxyproline dehydrogenase [Colius striatus]|uniref:hydroxyproline dehydrogenase n=1 Tax=Colius striatus TaxID=57412 RepID=UPI002B1D645D|nr:hydroxyproline dehydrogenase [Colius striatus]
MLALPCEDQAEEGEDKDGELWFDGNCAAALETVELAAAGEEEEGAGGGSQPLMQLKVTALMSARLCESVSRRLREGGSELTAARLEALMGGEAASFPFLSPAQNRHLTLSLQRLDRVASSAVARGVGVLVDAEGTEVNPALSLATAALAGRHNRHGAWVWNTYQAYLRDGPGRLQEEAELAARRGLCFGAKLVRGAYLERERLRAEQSGAPDPLQPDRAATDRSYHQCLDTVLPLVARRPQRFRLMVATHNEASVLYAARRMEELGIERGGGAVSFGQLLGMCDHVSLALGSAGYAVYKSVPWGPAGAVLPYLARRARENRRLLRDGARERRLLAGELRRRLTPWA